MTARILAKLQAPLFGAETTEDLLAQLGHSEVTLGLIVLKRRAQNWRGARSRLLASRTPGSGTGRSLVRRVSSLPGERASHDRAEGAVSPLAT